MDVKDKALELSGKGFNCAQSVFAACGEYTGLDEKIALAAAGSFGGGMRCGEMCGAVCGALMALGCCFPYNECADDEAKQIIARLTKQTTAAFEERFGALRCMELKKNGVSCDALIAFGTETAEKIILENK